MADMVGEDELDRLLAAPERAPLPAEYTKRFKRTKKKAKKKPAAVMRRPAVVMRRPEAEVLADAAAAVVMRRPAALVADAAAVVLAAAAADPMDDPIDSDGWDFLVARFPKGAGELQVVRKRVYSHVWHHEVERCKRHMSYADAKDSAKLKAKDAVAFWHAHA